MNPRLRKLLITFGVILVVLVAFAAWVMHGNPSDRTTDQTSGKTPLLVEAESETIPSVGLAKSIGWQPGEAPRAVAGLAVSRFAEGLDHPRTLLTLPNGDVLVAETNSPPRDGSGSRGITG
ncbi:MAG: sorbosone dehydrogenase family protein, partial [Sphingomonadales bacterium]|nr:sorbosone dehydrogenase family protein [Sphingomonadales bacterium]